MRYEQARDSDARAGGLRVSAIRTRSLRCLAVMVALVMVFMLLPTRAFASGQVSEWSSVWFHSSVDNAEQYIVGAYNKFDAAAYICGYTKQQVTSWDMAILHKLSTQDTAFLSLANSLQDVTPWNEDSLDDSLEDYFGTSLWQSMSNIAVGTSGIGINLNGLNSFQVQYWQMSKPADMQVWAVNTTTSAVAAAKEAVRQILTAQPDGGGGGVTAADTMTFNLQNYVRVYEQVQTGNHLTVNNVDYKLYSNPNVNADFPTGNSVTFTGLVNKSISSFSGFDFETYPNVLVFVFPRTSSLAYEIFALKDGYTCEIVDNRFKITPANNDDYYCCSTQSGPNITNLGITALPFDVTIDVSSRNTNRYTGITNIGLSSGGALYADNLTGGGGGGDDEPTGPGDWPEDPSPEPPESPTVPTPTPPELPTPYTPIIPPIVSPDPPTNVTDPTNWTDYTPWLQKILQQLRNMNDEIAEHCVHIQQQITDQATNIINEMYAVCERLMDYLDELFRSMTRYLDQLANWLADQLEYNDSSVLYWLRLIYQRLGKLIRTNGPTILEPDPTEPFDFWAWLWGLITNVIGGFIGDFVGDVGDLIDAVKDKFPFSIPWDIAAMLALLDANRVTPVFVINIPAINGWWAGYSYRIDLQPFDSVAAACRAMFNIVWCFVLIMKTNWMLMIMGDSTSLGERFANRVGRGTE